MEPIKTDRPVYSRDPLFKILAAVDKSRYAAVVMDTVSRIASFTECSVLILTVIDPKHPRKIQLIKDEESTSRNFHRDLIGKYFPQKEIEIESKFGDDSTKFIPVQGATIHSRTVEGDPADTICKWAENTNADLVVVGKRGARDSSASLLGSVSETVVHKCKRSVLVAIREKSDLANWETDSAGIQPHERSIP